MIPNSLEEYKNVMGIGSEDLGSRRLLLKKLLPTFKKKSPAYRLKKKQLVDILSHKNDLSTVN